MNFEKINFPIVNNVKGHTISESMNSVKPMTLEDAAAGRKIKIYPFKYDTFASTEDLKNYIENILYSDKNLKSEWLETGSHIHMPFNLRDDVYYTSVSVFSITCHKPAEHIMDDIIYGQTICELRPGDPLISGVHKIIEELKNAK